MGALGYEPLLTGRIELRDYDPNWPALYECEAARVRGALDQRVIRLEHVGSTSVPGLAAKPIIDIALEVPDSSDEEAYVPDLETAGYVLRTRSPEWLEHRMFRRAEAAVHLAGPRFWRLDADLRRRVAAARGKARRRRRRRRRASGG